MKNFTITKWKEFENVLNELDEYRNKIESDGSTLGVSEYLLFRGQSSHEWKLETTLERFINKDITLTNYYNFALAAQTRIETFTGEHWVLETPDEFRDWARNQAPLVLTNFKPYEYFAYLRHHGYPSPLLDWTKSPYIALFFAVNNMQEYHEHAAVYVYLEHAGKGKIGSSGKPFIHRFGPYANIHKRHFLQQSNYTICAQKEENDLYLFSLEKK